MNSESSKREPNEIKKTMKEIKKPKFNKYIVTIKKNQSKFWK
jgi:hypothetical protein